MILVVPEWAREDPDLFRHAVELEEKIKEHARREEEARKQRAVTEKVQAGIAKRLEKYLHQILTPQTIAEMENEARRFVRELEIRAGVPEEQSVAEHCTFQQHIHGELLLTVPQFAPHIVLEFEVGDPIQTQAAEGPGLAKDER